MVGAEGDLSSRPIHRAQGAYPNLKPTSSDCFCTLRMLRVPRTIPRSGQEQHRKSRKTLSQLSFLTQKSTWTVLHSEPHLADPPPRGARRPHYFFIFSLGTPRSQKISQGSGHLPPHSSRLSNSHTSVIPVYIYRCQI